MGNKNIGCLMEKILILEGGFKSQGQYEITRKDPNIGIIDLKKQKEDYANKEVPKRIKDLKKIFELL